MPFVDWRIRAPLGTPLGCDPYRPVREGSSHGHTIATPLERKWGGLASPLPAPNLVHSSPANEQLASASSTRCASGWGNCFCTQALKRTKRNWSIGVAKCQYRHSCIPSGVTELGRSATVRFQEANAKSV